MTEESIEKTSKLPLSKGTEQKVISITEVVIVSNLDIVSPPNVTEKGTNNISVEDLPISKGIDKENLIEKVAEDVTN